MRLGLPKGSILTHSERVLQRFAGAAYKMGKLSHVDDQGRRLLLLKHRDIPKLVSDGDLDFGVTGSEWIAESQLAIHVLGYLEWCNSRISVIGLPGARINVHSVGVCATEFPNIASRYLASAGLSRVTIKKISGSCEALIPALCNIGVDCVETGSTLRANGLAEFDRILTSRVALVSKDAPCYVPRERRAFLSKLIGDIQWVV